MKKREIFLLGVFLLIVLASTGLISAEGSCYIDTVNICNGNGHNVVMKLSSGDNAHGELASESNYNYALCCDFGSGGTTCDGNNKILGLSDVTNAHAERPEGSAYTEEVCYDSVLECFGSVDAVASEQDGEIPVISISSETNAHLGSYNFNIICEVNLCGNNNIDEGEECDDGNLNDGDGCSSTCLLEPATQCDNDGVKESGETCDGGDLDGKSCTSLGYDGGDLSCDDSCEFDTISCYNDPEVAECSLDNAYWSLQSDGISALTSNDNPVNNERLVYLVLEGSSCSTLQVEFTVTEGGASSKGDCETDLGCQNPNNVNFNSDVAIGEWEAYYFNEGGLNPEPEYYFTASLSADSSKNKQSNDPLLKVSEDSVDDYCNLGPVNRCSDYYTPGSGNPTAETACNDDPHWCDVASNPENVDYDSEADGYACQWNSTTSVCEFANIYTGPGGGLESIELTPSSAAIDEGLVFDGFEVFAYYTDESQNRALNPSSIESCSSSDTGVATRVGSSGCEFLGVSAGQTTVTISYTEAGVTQTDTATLTVVASGDGPVESHIRIIPTEKTILIGGTSGYTSILHMSDNSESDVTSGTSFSSSNTGVATINGNVATGESAGFSEISGTYNTHSNIALLHVEETPLPYELTEIELTPSSAAIDEGLVFDGFEVFAYYTDESQNRALNPSSIESCSSSDTGVATRVGSSGCEFLGVSAGQTTVTISYTEAGVTQTDTATLTVVASGDGPVESHIRIIPTEKTILIGGTSGYTSILHMSDNSESDVTSGTSFSSSNTGVATINGNVATGESAGFSEISGTYNTHSNIALLHVEVEQTGSTEIGRCVYHYIDTGDTCDDDGYLTVNYTASWDSPTGEPRPASCPEGMQQKSYECPAQIPLPFFNIFNFIAAILIIAMIYIGINVKKK